MVKFAFRAIFSLVLSVLVSGLLTTACSNVSSIEQPAPAATVQLSPSASTVAVRPQPAPADLLQESWKAYKQRFIQADGRVIDWEAEARTVSEGQAYAMLRAVLINDPETFALTLSWAESNLQRKEGQRKTDNLWAWIWGKDTAGQWVIQDGNFASDADIDAVTALILAARQWNRPDYLTLARTKLKDLWALSTVLVGNQRFLLPGPAIAFQVSPTLLKLNPSYGSPAAFRLFAQIDPEHDWLSLVESTYRFLQDSAQLSAVRLPSDWVLLNTETGQYQPVSGNVSFQTLTHQSVYSFDAYRVWWRVVLDAVWFGEPRARAFLQANLGHLQDRWKLQQSIPARIDLQGNALSSYEATAQYAMLYAGFALVDRAIADQIYQKKLLSTYQQGIWDNPNAYYVQNLAWFGLHAPFPPDPRLLRPTGT